MIPAEDNAELVRKLATDYLRRTGMTAADLARRIGYTPVTMGFFLTGRYRSMTRREDALCTAILDYIDAHPFFAGDGFAGHLYEIGNVKVMRDVFRRLVERPRIFMVYAPPGSGKTDVARSLIQEYNAKGDAERPYFYRVYCSVGITKIDLLRRIATACGTLSDTSMSRTINRLRFDLEQVRVAIYLDEAQHLSPECLEMVRELYDELHWSLCLAGSHELDRTFSRWAGTLEQFERRITDKVMLPAVTLKEASEILRSELPTLAPAQRRAVFDGCTVTVRSKSKTETYLSIGRLMAAIREIQEAAIAEDDLAAPAEAAS
jgi:DNA transposition AAA+ family ATPase